MKRTSQAVLGVLAVAVLAGPPLPAAALAQGDSQEEEAAPDNGLAALEARLAALEAELADTRALLDETVHYLHAQSEAARRLASALDAAEAAGFTAGINYKSRELLLSGWRSALSTRQTRLPGTTAPAPTD